MQERLVIIGSGMATARLLENLAEYHYGGQITVIGAETQPSYNRILLSSVLAGDKTEADLTLLDDGWYRKQGIELISGETVVELDTQACVLNTSAGRQVSYDKVIFATGSRAHIPDIPGVTARGVHGFRNLDDLSTIRGLAQSGAASAVVVGGGLLGLEAAHGLNLMGLDVTVVHRRPWLMNRQLDQQAGTLLQRQLEKRGITFVMSASPVEVQANNGRVSQLNLDNGEAIPADLLLFAAGIDPNRELAQASGIPCQRGIVADAFLSTHCENVYALGECAEIENRTFGLVAPIWRQTEILAKKLCGVVTSGYSHEDAPTQLKVSGIELFSAGLISPQQDCQSQVLHDDSAGIYRRLIFSGDRLAGAILLGDRSGGQWYDRLIQSKASIESIRPWLMFGPAYCEDAA